MTTLQIVLAVVGVVLIGAIVLYNIVQERRFRKESERMFAHKREDIMLGETVGGDAGPRGTEPLIQLGGDGGATSGPAGESAADAAAIRLAREEPAPPFFASLEPIEAEPAPARPAAAPARPAASPDAPAPRQAPPAHAQPRVVASVVEARRAGAEGGVVAPETPSGLDPVTEFVARLKFAAPAAADFTRLHTGLRRIGKPIRAHARRPDGGWDPLAGASRYPVDQVEFGIQLADRGGAVTQEHLDAFCRALYEFSAQEGGAVSCGDKQDALRAARALDLFGMEVDVLIGLNVVSADARPFTSEALRTLTEESRLTLAADGSYHARDAAGHTLFTLTNQEETPFPADGRGLTTHGVTLLFDVPRVADGLAVFDHMTRLGQDLARRLEGRLVDDNGRPVSDDSLNRDRARLVEFYARMAARGIPAGGERALRLFV